MAAADPRTLLAEKDAENARLREELGLLRNELAHLKPEFERMRGELAAANANTKELTVRIGELADAVAKGNDRIAELLAIVQRKKAPPKSKPKEPKAPASLDDKARKAFEDRPKPTARPGSAGTAVLGRLARPRPRRSLGRRSPASGSPGSSSRSSG